MSIIEQIYQNRVGEEHRLVMERKLDKQIEQILVRERYQDNEDIANLFFEVADYSQQAGFSEGIQFLILLLAEVLI